MDRATQLSPSRNDAPHHQPADLEANRFRFSIHAKVEEISGVVDEAMSRISAAGFGDDDSFAIETALREALANAVLHGAKSDPRKQVFGSFAIDRDGSISITVLDPGKGFDLTKVPDPLHQENLHSDHGRGIYLMRQLMDEVQFTQGGREIHMKKFRRK